jgi:hypothetical protein
LNADSSFFSLATIPALQTLIFDDNGITHVPKFHFGFEALTHLSLNHNKLELADDVLSLADVDQLEDVSLLGNPLILRMHELRATRSAFAKTNIQLRCDDAPPPVKQALAGPLRTVKFDPLALPSFTPAHLRALKRAQPPPPSPPKHVDDGVFMTAFGSKAGDDYQPPALEPTPLPDVEEPVITSVWNEVPVLQIEDRIEMSPQKKPNFTSAFRKLDFLVNHPEVRLRPREATSLLADQPEKMELLPDLMVGKDIVVPKRKSQVASKLAARTEYTKTEIQNMLGSMEERLNVVERDLAVTDESGQDAVEMALDSKNFLMLHKQYESIRAELINTLNS